MTGVLEFVENCDFKCTLLLFCALVMSEEEFVFDCTGSFKVAILQIDTQILKRPFINPCPFLYVLKYPEKGLKFL